MTNCATAESLQTWALTVKRLTPIPKIQGFDISLWITQQSMQVTDWLFFMLLARNTAQRKISVSDLPSVQSQRDSCLSISNSR